MLLSRRFRNQESKLYDLAGQLRIDARGIRFNPVEVGRHGIIVSKGFYKGLLLPQVPVEQRWDRETYLAHGCLKAGLPPEEWKRGAKIEVFTAQVFSE